MKKLYINVGSTVEIVKPCYLSANEVNTVECIFNLPTEYSGLIVKAQFTNIKPVTRLIADGKCNVPPEALAEEGNLTIGVIAYASDGEELVVRHSPTPAHIRVYEGSFDESAEESSVASPTVFEQQVAQMKSEAEKITAESATSAATKATNDIYKSQNSLYKAIDSIAEANGADLSAKVVEGSEITLTNVKNIDGFGVLGNTTQTIDENGNYVVEGVGKHGPIIVSVIGSNENETQTVELPDGIELHGGNFINNYRRWLDENPEEFYDYIFGTTTPNEDSIESLEEALTEMDTQVVNTYLLATRDAIGKLLDTERYMMKKSFFKIECTVELMQQAYENGLMEIYADVAPNGERFFCVDIVLTPYALNPSSYGEILAPQFSNYLPVLNPIMLGNSESIESGFCAYDRSLVVVISEKYLSSFTEEGILNYIKEKEDAGNPLTFWYTMKTPQLVEIELPDETKDALSKIELYSPSTTFKNNYGANQMIQYVSYDYNTRDEAVFYGQGSLPTVFSNEELNKLQGRNYSPKAGDRLVVPDSNAVYKYHEYNPENPVRVYAYQPFRNNVNIAGDGSKTGELVGNYTGYADNTAPLSGNLSLENTRKVMSQINEHFDNTNNKLFNNSCFKLVADFDYSYASSTDRLKSYLINNSSKFPKLKLTGGQLNDIVFLVRFRAAPPNYYNYVGTHINATLIDNSFAILQDGKVMAGMWAADCWYDNGNSSEQVCDGINILNQEYDWELYWAEQEGGEGLNLFLPIHPSSNNGSGIFDGNWKYSIPFGGEWVYEGSIAEVAYTRNIEASPDAITTVTGNSNLSYTTLDMNARVGDMHVRTPDVPEINALNFISVMVNALNQFQVWRCKYSQGYDKQVWERIF